MNGGLAAAAVIALLVSVDAQQPRFRTSVNYVPVDVVVTDKDDRPVTDLTAADFEIRENGRLQRIVDFEGFSTPPASRAIDVRAQPLPPADVGSNARPPSGSRAIVVRGRSVCSRGSGSRETAADRVSDVAAA